MKLAETPQYYCEFQVLPVHAREFGPPTIHGLREAFF